MIDGNSPLVHELRVRVARYAVHDLSVLIRGESGVGKERVARGLHLHSARARERFVPVNCGALPTELVEAHLFGTVAGAFTGARAQQGLIAAADRGTLFLDEIAELSTPAQVALLRVLESREVWAVGADRGRKIDFRLVAATHRDVELMVREGAFREDLYHRLAALSIPVPPLRDRVEDLPALVAALAPDLYLTDGALRRLRAYPWPGNVRELRNVLARARVEGDGQQIRPVDLHLEGARLGPQQRGTLKQQTAATIRAAMARHGNVRATARALQISPTTVYKYLGQVP